MQRNYCCGWVLAWMIWRAFPALILWFYKPWVIHCLSLQHHNNLYFHWLFFLFNTQLVLFVLSPITLICLWGSRTIIHWNLRREKRNCLLIITTRNSLAVPCLRLHSFNARSMSSIPSWGAEISHSTQQPKGKKKNLNLLALKANGLLPPVTHASFLRHWCFLCIGL